MKHRTSEYRYSHVPVCPVHIVAQAIRRWIYDKNSFKKIFFQFNVSLLHSVIMNLWKIVFRFECHRLVYFLFGIFSVPSKFLCLCFSSDFMHVYSKCFIFDWRITFDLKKNIDFLQHFLQKTINFRSILKMCRISIFFFIKWLHNRNTVLLYFSHSMPVCYHRSIFHRIDKIILARTLFVWKNTVTNVSFHYCSVLMFSSILLSRNMETAHCIFSLNTFVNIMQSIAHIDL